MAVGLWSAANLFAALNLTYNLPRLKVRARKTRLQHTHKPFIATLAATVNGFLCTNFKAEKIEVKLKAANKFARTSERL